MATFKKGDMWQRWGECDLFCVTTSSTIKNDGTLVMGAGIAKEMRDAFPFSDLVLGKLIGDNVEYGLAITKPSRWFPDQLVGAFQIKKHYREVASLHLIRLATTLLFEYIVMEEITSVCLNFSGIGNGKLSRDEILPIISLLPDCVEIWEYE